MIGITNWWLELSPREKWLIGIAGTLLSLVILWQFILLPGLNWRADEKNRSDAAFRTVEQIQQAYFRERAAGNIILVETERPRQLSGEAFKSAIIQASTRGGLSISRLQAGDRDLVSVTIDRADPRIVFFWLQDVEISAGAIITRLVLEPSGDSQVRVSVDFKGSAQ